MSEFTAADFEGKTPDEIATMTNDRVSGLVTNRDSFRSEKDVATQKAKDAEDEAEQLRQQNVQAQQDLLESQGKFKEAQTLRDEEHRNQLAVEKSLRESLVDANKSRDTTSTMSELMKDGHPDWIEGYEAMLSNALSISYNDDNVAQHKFTHKGETVATDVEGFRSWASTNETYKKFLKGVDSGGAGVTQSNGGQSSGENSAFKQRLKAAGLTQ